MEIQDFVGDLFQEFSPYLNERQIRIFSAICAKIYGFGGSTKISNATGIARTTINRGLKELDQDEEPYYSNVRKKEEGERR